MIYDEKHYEPAIVYKRVASTQASRMSLDAPDLQVIHETGIIAGKKIKSGLHFGKIKRTPSEIFSIRKMSSSDASL